ncbi:hypothetical protein Tco_0800857 [Tanacetum coccineum]|uniref:DUF4216 domain-containing protein n=1 Tax=Tanacetum coccineum TaxID=301880 RepID=A0ABQ4ZUB6_9ASTR
MSEKLYYGLNFKKSVFSYLSFKVVLFRVKWFDTRNEGRKVQRLVLRNNMTQILTKDEAFKDDQYILATQVKQCYYLEDMARRPPHWKVVEHVNHKKFSDGGVIVVEEDPDMLHGAIAVTVAVMIVPLHTIYLPVSGVASLTEEKAPFKAIGWKKSGPAAYPPGDPEPRVKEDHDMIRLSRSG